MFGKPDVRDTGFLIRLIHDALGRRLDKELLISGLTSSQTAVLAFLWSREGAYTTIRDVQGFLNVSHTTVAGIVKRLEKKGWVNVTIDPEDRRAHMLSINENTEQTLDLTRKPSLDVEKTLLRGLSDQEKKQLNGLLLRVYQNIR